MSRALDEARRALQQTQAAYRGAVSDGDKQTALALQTRVDELQDRIIRLSRKD